MSHFLVWPSLPFLVLLMTRLRWAVLASAICGALVAMPLTSILPRADVDAAGWLRWFILVYGGAISVVMAVAEALAAKIMLRGRFWLGFAFALAAHAAWLWYLVDESSASRVSPIWAMLIVQTAMIGSTAATLGAYRGK